VKLNDNFASLFTEVIRTSIAYFSLSIFQYLFKKYLRLLKINRAL